MISKMVRSVKPTDNCLQVLDWMQEDHVSHLPVVVDQEFLGIVSDTAILDVFEADKNLEEAGLTLNKFHVPAHLHIYELIRVIYTSTLTAIPVLDPESTYLGVITIHNVYEQFVKLSAINEPGGVLVLEMNIKDYSLSEVARLVESCNAIILSTYTVIHTDSTKMDLTIKVNKADLSELIATFERFSYNIKYSMHESDAQEDMQDRFEELMNYLNM